MHGRDNIKAYINIASLWMNELILSHQKWPAFKQVPRVCILSQKGKQANLHFWSYKQQICVYVYLVLVYSQRFWSGCISVLLNVVCDVLRVLAICTQDTIIQTRAFTWMTFYVNKRSVALWDYYPLLEMMVADSRIHHKKPRLQCNIFCSSVDKSTSSIKPTTTKKQRLQGLSAVRSYVCERVCVLELSLACMCFAAVATRVTTY